MMSRSTGANWIERGAPPEPVMCRVLAAFLDLDPESPPRELESDARTIRGMAEANANELQVVSYLKDIERRFGREGVPPVSRRTVAVCLWHIAKVGEIREQLLRLQAQTARQSPQEPLSDWLAARILRESPRVGDDTG
jgi:hypothetical protein